MGLVLPPGLQRELDVKALAETERGRMLLDRHAHLRWLEREMKALDPDLALERAVEHPTPESGLKGGYWHLVRRGKDAAPDQYIPWEFPDGSFREPDGAILDFLRSRDLQNPEVWEHATRAWQREVEQRARALEDKREERVDAMATAIKATEPGVLFSDGPWTYRTKAKKAV